MNILEPEDYFKVRPLLGKARINVMFARMIVEQTLPGTIYADDAREPSAFLIRHPYGMSLLLGCQHNRAFNEWLLGYMMNSDGARKGKEWLQAFPGTWDDKIHDLLGRNLASPEDTPSENGRVLELTRVNFRFRWRRHKENIADALSDSVVPTTPEMFDSIDGKVVPKNFWKDAVQFSECGYGFSTVADGVPVSTAFSAFVHEGKLEIGIETAEGHRGKGYAEHAARGLIYFALRHGYEPIWSCRMDNVASFNLARKLGFQPVKFIPCYELVSRP